MRTSLARILSVALLAASATGCSDGSSYVADLPEGWEGARRIGVLRQSACQGDPYGNDEDRVEVMFTGDRVHVDYESAHFRCMQALDAFLRVDLEDGEADVLVQPLDMSPDVVPRCDCLYDLSLGFDLEPGEYEVKLYRRWDHRSGDDAPVKVGHGAVQVP